MENFNTVPSTGKYGDSIAVVNENFMLAQQEMEILRNLISPDTKFVTAVATAQTTSVTQVLPETGSSDTVYRVGSWDGIQYNDSVFSEYAWNGTAYIKLSTKSQAGEVYDISANHSGAKYADLSAALSGTNVPVGIRRGGMSVKFVQSSDNKYVQYRSTSLAFNTDPIYWQKQGAEVTVSQNKLTNEGQISVGANKYMFAKTNNIFAETNFIGHGNTITPVSELLFISGNFANKILRFYIDKNISMTGVTVGSAYTKFQVCYYNSSNTLTVLLDVKMSDTYLDFYDIVIPDGVANLTIQGRCEDGVLFTCYIEDITDANKLIKLSEIGTGSLSGAGDKFYSPTSKKLFYVVSTNPLKLVELPKIDGAIYTYNDAFYIWDGTDLVLSVNATIDSTKGNAEVTNGKSALAELALGDKLIQLTEIGQGYQSTNIGDVFYNPDTKLLKKCINNVGGYDFEVVPFYEGAIYTYNSQLYIWNGTDLVLYGSDLVKKPRPSSGAESFSVKINGYLAELDTNNEIGDIYSELTDWGNIWLPTNYTQSGEPVPLAIICHGSGCTWQKYRYCQEDPSDSGRYLYDPAQYLVSKGYACMDMFASPYDLAFGNDLHMGNPRVLLCYKAGYEYVKKNYNVVQDAVFVSGSSMGGISAIQIAQSGLFPVKAIAGYCPCVDLYKEAYCYPWNINGRKYVADYFGFEGTQPTFGGVRSIPTQDEIDYFVSNKDKIIGFNPISSLLVGGDYANTFTYLPSNMQAVYDATESAIYEQFRAILDVPIKIWHNKDDTVVLYRYSKYFIDMLRRGGCKAYLRPFNSGGHSGWNSGDEVTDTDIDGNTITTHVAQREGYLWFERFR